MHSNSGELAINRNELVRRPAESGYAVDPDNPVEVDDAISLAYSEGTYQVKVHIADGGLIAQQPDLINLARTKGWSTYDLSDESVSSCDPMLPRPICRDTLSLDIVHYGLGSPAVTVRFELDEKYKKIRDFDIYKSRLSDCQSLTHKEFLDAYRSQEPAIQSLVGVARLLRDCHSKSGRRFTADSLADQTVREFMLATNSLIGKFMSDNSVPWMYRTFTQSNPKKEALAMYSAVPERHDALDLNLYSHFTSPLRRFADLVNHLNLGAILEFKPVPYEDADIALLSKELHLKRLIGRQAIHQLAA